MFLARNEPSFFCIPYPANTDRRRQSLMPVVPHVIFEGERSPELSGRAGATYPLLSPGLSPSLLHPENLSSSTISLYHFPLPQARSNPVLAPVADFPKRVVVPTLIFPLESSKGKDDAAHKIQN